MKNTELDQFYSDLRTVLKKAKDTPYYDRAVDVVANIRENLKLLAENKNPLVLPSFIQSMRNTYKI